MGAAFMGWRRKAVFLLSVSVLSIACATTTKKLSEDLQKDGFTISVCNAKYTDSGPTVTVTDAESIDRLLQWFRNCPRASDELETAIVQKLMHDMGPLSQTIRIETPRFRVNIPNIDLFIVLETRNTSTDEWKQSSWKMRKEDGDLRNWVLSRLTEAYGRDLRATPDSDSVPRDPEKPSN